MLPAAVILDRDGVINEDSDNYILAPGQWQPIAGSLDAIARLNAAGIPVCVATNQSAVGRQYMDVNTLDAIHKAMETAVNAANGHLADVVYCPHHPDDGCSCRKPAPGMLLTLAERNHFDIRQAVFVGDSARDLQAADAAGCTGVLVLTGKGRETRRRYPEVPCFDNLSAYVTWMLGRET